MGSCHPCRFFVGDITLDLLATRANLRFIFGNKIFNAIRILFKFFDPLLMSIFIRIGFGPVFAVNASVFAYNIS